MPVNKAGTAEDTAMGLLLCDRHHLFLFECSEGDEESPNANTLHASLEVELRFCL